jgi:hypothetical protein
VRLQAATSPPFFEQGSSSRSLAEGGGAAAAAADPAGLERVGVLLLNLGGPDSLEDVQPFLYNLFADPDIIRLPAPVQFLQPAIASLVSSLRAPKSREGYEAIGGGSPLRRITEEQATALRASLRRKGIDANTYVAMRYWFPFTGRASACASRGAGELACLFHWCLLAGNYVLECWAAAAAAAACSPCFPAHFPSPTAVCLPACRGGHCGGEGRRHHAAGGAAVVPTVQRVHQRLQPAPAGKAAERRPGAGAGAQTVATACLPLTCFAAAPRMRTQPSQALPQLLLLLL